MSILEVECPVCFELLELSPEDRAGLEVGDVIVCDSCNAEMEVTRNSGEDFELELLGVLTTCPACGEEFEITEDMVATAPTLTGPSGQETTVVACPHCRASIELEFADEDSAAG